MCLSFDTSPLVDKLLTPCRQGIDSIDLQINYCIPKQVSNKMISVYSLPEYLIR